jgi:hypothetical protein
MPTTEETYDYNDGLSRCECCHDVTPHDRLVSARGIIPHPTMPRNLCHKCDAVLLSLEIRTRRSQDLPHIRRARAAGAYESEPS